MIKFKKWNWVALLIILGGSAFRIYHLFIIFPFDEPFRLGGLFYEFSHQIVLNNFAFPETIPYYSQGGIPFAYPPVSFYLQALLISLLDPPLFITVDLLPPLVTLLSLPAFFWMISQYSDDMNLILSGLFSFAMMPVAFMNQIEAAGMAESFGITALIIYLGLLFRWQKQPTLKVTLLAGLSLGFCILSSPGSAYAAALLSVLLFFRSSIRGFKQKSLSQIGMLFILGLVGILISAPYWLSVINNHGVSLFITPLLGQHQISANPLQFELFLGFQPGGTTLSFFWNWLILAGLIWAVLNRSYWIVAIFFLFWLIPREGIWLVSIPAAILSGLGLTNVFLPLFKKVTKSESALQPTLVSAVLVLILIILIFANNFFTITAITTDSDWVVKSNQLESLKEIQANIPSDGKVIVIGNTALTEWAPALLQREVLNIEYGLEWQPDELEKVQGINESLEERDFIGMINKLMDYVDVSRIYLVSIPDILEEFPLNLPPNTTMTLISSKSELDLYELKFR